MNSDNLKKIYNDKLVEMDKLKKNEKDIFIYKDTNKKYQISNLTYEIEKSKLDYENSCSKVNKLLRELNSVRRFDEKVIYHSISDKNNYAMHGIFFTHFPKLLYQMFNFGFLSYYYLNNSDKLTIDSDKSNKNNYSYHEYYLSHRYTSISIKKEPDLDFYISPPPNSKDINITDIFDIEKETDGVWYPGKILSISWKNYNPYIFTEIDCMQYFTAKLSNSNFQNLVEMADFQNIKSDRGNWWVANQHLKPKGFTKEEFASFCQIRSFPKQQLEKLLYYL
jgi:hypothetical protein